MGEVHQPLWWVEGWVNTGVDLVEGMINRVWEGAWMEVHFSTPELTYVNSSKMPLLFPAL